MSGSGSTTLILKIEADKSGLDALRSEFQKFNGEISSGLSKMGSSARTSAASGAQELAQMRQQISGLASGLTTIQTLLTETGKKSEESAKKVATARAEAEGRAIQMVLAGEQKLTGEMNALRLKRMQSDQAAATGMVEAEARAVQMVLAGEQKLAGEMAALKTARVQANAAEEAQRVRAHQAAIAAMVAAENELTLKLLGRDIGSNARAASAGDRLSGASGLAAAKAQADATAKLTVETDKLTGAGKRNTEAMRAQALASRELHDGMRGLAGGLNMLWTTYGSFLPIVGGFALSAGIKKAIEVGSEFSYQMQFAGTVSGATRTEIEQLSTQFRGLAETSMFSSIEIAKGYRILAQAGFSAQETMKLMPALLRFSTVGEIEMGQAAEIAAGQMHAFGLSTEQVPHLLDAMAKAGALTQTNIGEMGQAMRQASTVAEQYGVSVDEMSTLLAVLAQRNIRASAAGTAVRNMFIELDPHTEKAKRAFGELGISIDNGAGGYKKIIPLIQEFAEKFSKYDQISQARLANSLFNERGAKAFLNAISASRGELQRLFGEIQNSDGYIKSVDAQLQKTFKYQAVEAVNAFKNSLEQAFDSVNKSGALTKLASDLGDIFRSDGFKQGVTTIVQAFADLAKWLIENKELAGGFVVGVAGITTALKVLGGTMATLGAAAGAAGVAGVGATAAAAGSGMVGLALFGGLGAGWILDQLSEIARAADLPAIRIILNPVKAVTEAAGDWLGRDLNNSLVNPSRNSRTLTYGGGPTRSPGGILDESAGLNFPSRPPTKPSGSLVYNDRAAEQAAQAVKDENRRYQIEETSLKASLDTRLAIIKAYHDTRLTTDAQFIQEEKAAIDSSYQQEQAALTRHISALEAQRNKVKPEQRIAIDQQIDAAREKFANNQLKRDAQLVAAQAKAIKDEIDLGQRAIDNIEKKNDAIQTEIDALNNFIPKEKDSAAATADHALKKLELAKATMLAQSAEYRYNDTATEAQKLHWAGIQAIDAEIERIKKLRQQNVDLLETKKALENDWRVGAIKGIQEYMDKSLSTVEIVKDGVKKAFGAMEDALVQFVMTGKLGFKDMVNSMISDVVRMVVQANITKPLAGAVNNLLQGASGGGGILDIFSSIFGGGKGGSGAFTDMEGGGSGGLSSLFSGGMPSWAGGTSAAPTSLLGGAGSMLGGAGVGFGIGSIAHALFGNNRNSTGMQSGAAIGGAIGSVVPVIGTILGSVIGAALGSLLKSGGGPKDGGSYYSSYNARGDLLGAARVPGSDNGRFFTPTGQDSQAATVGGSIASEYYRAARLFGGAGLAGEFGIGWDMDPKGTSDSRVSSSAILGGQTIYSSMDRSIGRDPEKFDTEIATEAKRVLVAALQATDFGTEINEIFDDLGDVSLLGLDALTAALEKATDLSKVITALKNVSGKGDLNLEAIRAYQGPDETLSQTFDRVAGAWESFSQKFKPAADVIAAAATEYTDVFAAIGAAGIEFKIPTTNEEFYRLAQSMDLTTETGRELFTRLMGVSEGFDMVSRAAEQAKQRFQSAATQMSGQFGKDVAQSNLMASIETWRGINSGNGGFSQQQTMQALYSLVDNPAGLSSAYSYASSIGKVDELSGMLEAFNAYRSAQDQGTSSVQNFSSAVNDASTSIQDVRDSIEDWAKGKILGDTSPLLPQEKLKFALDEYDRVVKAKDTGAFTGAGDNLLDIARKVLGSTPEFRGIFDRVMADSEQMGGFKLNYDTSSAASMDSLRTALVEELRLARAEDEAYREEVRRLTGAIEEAGRNQLDALREVGEMTRQAILDAMGERA